MEKHHTDRDESATDESAANTTTIVTATEVHDVDDVLIEEISIDGMCGVY